MRSVSTEAGSLQHDGTTPAGGTVERPGVIRIVHRRTADEWSATSPDARSIKMADRDLTELRQRLGARLRSWLSPQIRIEETVEREAVR